MDRRTIIFGVAILALIIIVWYFMFRKRGEPDTGVVPGIIPLSVTQSIEPYENKKKEEYRIMEYYDNDDLSKKISFTVKWQNSYGFDNVTAVKLVHSVKPPGVDSVFSEVQSKRFDSDEERDYRTSLASSLSHPFPGSSLPNDTSVLGLNKFELFYTYDKNITTETPDKDITWGTMALKTSLKFPEVTISQKDLRITLDLLETATYLFQPSVKSFTEIIPTYADTDYYIYVYNPDATSSDSIITIPYTVNPSYGNKPIILTPSSSKIDYGTKSAFNMYIKLDDRLLLLGKTSDGTLGEVKDVTSGKADFIISEKKDGTTTIDNVFHIQLAGTEFTNEFIFYSALTGKYFFSNLSDITNETIYKTISLKFSTTPTGTLDCIQNISRSLVHEQNTPGSMCGGSQLTRGYRCVTWSTVQKPTPGGVQCTEPVAEGESQRMELVDLDCKYNKDGEILGDGCKTCKNNKNPTEESVIFRATHPATGEGECDLPKDFKRSCPVNPCDDCPGEWVVEANSTQPDFLSDSSGCSTDLINNPSKRVEKFKSDPETDTCKTHKDDGKLRHVPAIGSCPGKDECKRIPFVNFNQCFEGRKQTWEVVSNPHLRSSDEPNCGPAGYNYGTYTSACIEALGSGGDLSGSDLEKWCANMKLIQDEGYYPTGYRQSVAKATNTQLLNYSYLCL